jgi:hypothetical protein
MVARYVAIRDCIFTPSFYDNQESDKYLFIFLHCSHLIDLLRHDPNRRRRAGSGADHRCRALYAQTEHLPRERVVEPAPAARRRRGARLHKLGGDMIEMLEVVPPVMEGDPASAREIYLPRLRRNQQGAGAVSCYSAQPGGPALLA